MPPRPSATPRDEMQRRAPVDIAPTVAPGVAALAPPPVAAPGSRGGMRRRGSRPSRVAKRARRLTATRRHGAPATVAIGYRVPVCKVGCECCLEDWSTVAIGASRLTMTPCVHARFPPHMALQAEVDCAECQSLICEGCSNRVEEGVLCCWCHSRVGIDSAVGDRMATDPYSPIDDTAIACSSSSSARPSTIAPSPIAKGQQADDEEALPTPKMPQESPSPKSPVVVDISDDESKVKEEPDANNRF